METIDNSNKSTPEYTLESIQNFKGKYPKQLWYLFLVEMWERFTFYGMRALLGLYISHLILSADYHPLEGKELTIKQEKFHEETKETLDINHPKYYVETSKQKYRDDAEAISNKRYGMINAFIYAMAFIGGLFADKLFGFRRSIFWGGTLMAIGTFLMAIPGSFAFYLGVSILIVGNGFFKPNISTMVGALYKDGDPRRDAGFSLFYSGINIGALLSGLTIAYIGTSYSWSLGFSLAGVCMLLGLALFIFTQRTLGPIGLPPKPEVLDRKVGGVPRGLFMYLGTLLFIPVFFLLVYYPVDYNMTGVFGAEQKAKFDNPGNSASLSGLLLIKNETLSNDSVTVNDTLRNVRLSLKDEGGKVISSANTDANGKFILKEINSSEVHSLSIDTTYKSAQILTINSKNEKSKLTADEKGNFSILTPYIVQLSDIIFMVAALLTLMYLIYEIRKATKEEGRKLIAAVILIFFSVIFWSFFEQGGGSLNFFANGNVESHGLNMTSVNNSINALWVVALAPLVGLLWLFLNKRKKEPNTVVKFGLGFLFLGVGFLVFFMSKFSADADGKTPLMMFCFAYLILTIGELCLSPIGLSMVTKLSPKRLYGVMMGTWFLASAYGQYGAGLIGAALAKSDSSDENLTNVQKLEQYTAGYETIAYISIAGGLVLILLSPFIRKLMGAVK